MAINDHVPSVWDIYASTLLFDKQYDKALGLYNKILRKSVADIAYGPHGEGWRWAQSIHTDAFFWKACCYDCKGDYREAFRLAKLHLRKRQRGVVSEFTIDKVRNFIKYLEAKLH